MGDDTSAQRFSQNGIDVQWVKAGNFPEVETFEAVAGDEVPRRTRINEGLC